MLAIVRSIFDCHHSEIRVGLPSTKEKRVIVAEKLSRAASASVNSKVGLSASHSSKTGPSTSKPRSGGNFGSKSPSRPGDKTKVAPSQHQEASAVVVA
jgi:hypothetical protein